MGGHQIFNKKRRTPDLCYMHRASAYFESGFRSILGVFGELYGTQMESSKALLERVFLSKARISDLGLPQSQVCPYGKSRA